MNLGVGLMAGLCVGLGLSACGTGAHTSGHHPSASEVVSIAEAGSDVGDGRPDVSYDGPLIRRRETLGLRIAAGAHVERLIRDLAVAERRDGFVVTAVSPDVLDASQLERLTPALVWSLPSGTTGPQARRAMRVALTTARRDGVEVRNHAVGSVLVHDLRFTVGTSSAHAVSGSIAREGILADALGAYASGFGNHRLDILYTGPLLSDRLLLSVRQGIARAAHVGLAAVTITPRSATGGGVYLADEPPPPTPSFTVSGGTHEHH